MSSLSFEEGTSGVAALCSGLGALARRDEFGTAHDIDGLAAERDWLRQLRVPVTVRFEGGEFALLVGVVLVAVCVGAPVRVSAAPALADAVTAMLWRAGASLATEDRAGWAAVLQGRRASAGVRLIGGSCERFTAHSVGRPDNACHG